jgi:hypothetical protein
MSPDVLGLARHVVLLAYCANDSDLPVQAIAYGMLCSQMTKRGMDVEVRGKDGWTPLLVAATAGHVKAAEELLSAKANINALGDNGETALIVACASSQKEMAQVHPIPRCPCDHALRRRFGPQAAGCQEMLLLAS